ncbi:MAG TPA: PhoH family protein [Alcanivoracaceae bacterium]|nr:PhoH family protein [Alcanivoracaceae bacterium]
MTTSSVTHTVLLEPYDAHRLARLCGQLDSNIKLIAKRLAVDIANRGNRFTLTGNQQAVSAAQSTLERLYQETEKNTEIAPETVHLFLQPATTQDTAAAKQMGKQLSIRTQKKRIEPRGENQRAYLESIRQHDVNFGIGPAGTGKTWLAVACAVEALERDEVERILLVRPAVEAGEKLGFLPGDLTEKIDPYLRPLYDALHEMLGYEEVTRLQEKNVIEVAPLAYMRGRTLNRSFIILDESQNTTVEQMKMFLTRIGFGSKAVITGDMTQIDLPRHQSSGLVHATRILAEEEGISITAFASTDVVRHPLVQRIIEAYERYDLEQDNHD